MTTEYRTRRIKVFERIISSGLGEREGFNTHGEDWRRIDSLQH
jgi:hypothetical protein